eukprot:1182487-Prorocentrum_minimum.AAC.3
MGNPKVHWTGLAPPLTAWTCGFAGFPVGRTSRKVREASRLPYCIGYLAQRNDLDALYRFKLNEKNSLPPAVIPAVVGEATHRISYLIPPTHVPIDEHTAAHSAQIPIGFRSHAQIPLRLRSDSAQILLRFRSDSAQISLRFCLHAQIPLRFRSDSAHALRFRSDSAHTLMIGLVWRRWA